MSKRTAFAGAHDIDVEGLLSKVSMNSAFLKLAKEDTELIQEMD